MKQFKNKKVLAIIILAVAIILPVAVIILTTNRSNSLSNSVVSEPIVISGTVETQIPSATGAGSTAATTTTATSSTTTSQLVPSTTTTTAPAVTTTSTTTTTTTTPTAVTQAPTTNTYTGKLYTFSIDYPLDWKIKASSSNSQVESLNLVPQDSRKVSFRMSVNPDGTHVSLPQGYLEMTSKQITVNGINVTSKLYKPDPDIFDNMANSRYVRIDLNSGKEYIVESTFDTSNVANGWDIINQIFTTLKF